MRYLKNRDEFLNKRIELDRSQMTQYYPGSRLIKEVFESDITWGGSLIGRLINSTIRLVKAGAKTAQMPAVVEALRTELDSLMLTAISSDMKKQVDLFRLKSILAEIKSISLEPSGSGKFEEEVKILNKLIGLDQMIPNLDPNDIASSIDDIEREVYDPNDPDKMQRTLGVVQTAHDTIKDDLPQLKDNIGKQEYETILDNLSSFNDALRRYVYQLTGEEPGGDTSTSVRRFTGNFNQILNVISNSRQTT
jgi:hypothetical protein